MKKSSPTVTIAVSVYNEAGNLREFLKSVLTQKEQGFKITGIWIHNDGSTDSVSKIVESLKHPKIKLWNHKKRTGKATRLNQIYRDLKSDFLVQSDADVIFAHKLVVRDLIKPLIIDPYVGMSGGNPEPLPGSTFFEKICKAAFEPYQEFRSEVRGGDNAFSCVGQLLAFKKEVVKKIKVPSNMIVNDVYTYFCCLSLGHKYKFVKTARVLYRAPQNLKDIVKQNTRFQIGYRKMPDFFDPKLVEREFKIPRWLLYKKLFTQFLKHPLYSAVYFLINNYCRFKTATVNTPMNAKWPMAKSTKKLKG